LLPAGARKLQEVRDSEDESVNVKSIYKDKSVSETFVQHSLNIFTVYNQLKARYRNELAFFTKIDLASFEHFPKPLPDAFISLEANDDTTRHYFLEVVEDSQPFFTVIRKVKKYLDHKESGEWAITETKYPAVLFICESVSLHRRLQKQIMRIMKSAWVDDLRFATTTMEELKQLQDNDNIWRIVAESDDKAALSSI
jgi:hypothetical protein